MKKKPPDLPYDYIIGELSDMREKLLTKLPKGERQRILDEFVMMENIMLDIPITYDCSDIKDKIAEILKICDLPID